MRGINISLGGVASSCTQVGSYCISNFGTDYDYVSCGEAAANSTDPTVKDIYDTYCAPYNTTYSADYWAGANKKCIDEGMHLPTLDELQLLHSVFHGQEGIPTSGKYFTSYANSKHAGYIDFSGQNNNEAIARSTKLPILCFQ